MKPTTSVPMGTALLAGFFCLLTSLRAETDPSPDEFMELFNGKDFSGWHGNDPHTTLKAKDPAVSLQEQAKEFPECWRVENGEMVNNGTGPYATTDREFGDFELTLEFKITPGTDSGIYLRGVPQVQIWDTTEAAGKWKHGADKGSGGLWNNGKSGAPGRDPLVHADRPLGEWNKLRARMLGARTWIWLNDQLVVDGVALRNYWSKGKTPVPARGPIQLQTHGGETRWRNIMLREISAQEANELLGAIDADGFEPIFNGRDLTGWQGNLDQYEIVDGALFSLRGGNLFTDKHYRDFDWKLEFKLPPGGNNGLAIRYAGQGNPAYAGMCELQVLDDGAPQYAKLDSRQYHGSAYGKVAAVRGYQRPVGDWNHQVVSVSGSRIAVELNGTSILDTDLADVTEFMKGDFRANIPEEGYLGFAGHGKGVAFRNLAVRALAESGK
jgi:hypothetical protein